MHAAPGRMALDLEFPAMGQPTVCGVHLIIAEVSSW